MIFGEVTSLNFRFPEMPDKKETDGTLSEVRDVVARPIRHKRRGAKVRVPLNELTARVVREMLADEFADRLKNEVGFEDRVNQLLGSQPSQPGEIQRPD
jgi:hypothetical protein